MRYLSLIRHAEAVAPEDQRDFDRVLSSYGIQMAPRLGRRLEKQGFKPDAVFVSPASRTLETARIICYEIGFHVDDMQIQNKIYGASLRQLVQLVRDAEEDVKHLLLVGHNPGLSELVSFLCADTGTPTYMSTCSVVRLELSIEYWALVEEGCARFLEYDTPENMSI